jgi:hypothetical protein
MIIEEILIKGHFIIGHGWSKEFFEFQTQPAGCSPGRYNAGAAVTTNYKQPIYMYYFICRFTMYHDSDSQVNITSPWGPSIKVVHLIKIPILIHHKEMTNFEYDSFDVLYV